MPDTSMTKPEEKHWKLARYSRGLEVYDKADDEGGGDFGSLSGEQALTREEAQLLKRHETRQANHAKETKNLILQRKYELSQGVNNFGNADEQQFGGDKPVHPVLGDKAQFSGAEEFDPFSDNDNNQERQHALRLRKSNDLQPTPRTVPTPTLSMG